MAHYYTYRFKKFAIVYLAMDKLSSSEIPVQEVLSPRETALKILDDEKKVLSGLGTEVEFPEIQLSDNAPASEVIPKLLKHNAKMFEFFDEHIFVDYQLPIYDPFIATMLKNQKIVDNLEPIALKERLDTDKPVAEIVRFNSTNESALLCKPKPVYKGGTPHLIALANAENGSAYEQLRQVAKSVVDPIIEIQEKTNLIKCVCLNGSIVSETKKPGDIDLVLITKEKFPYNIDKLKEGLSENAIHFLYTLSDIGDRGGEDSKIEFDIAGDTITEKHTLEITVETEAEFLKFYKIEGEMREKYLEINRAAMTRFSPEKAPKYEHLGLTHSETVVETGGQIIFGDNIKDRDGKDVFKYRDDDLLK